MKDWETTATGHESPKPTTTAAGFAASSRAVRIAGWGLTTPLGIDASSTWAALLAGRFITDHALVPLAEAQDGSRITRLATLVAREAIGSSRWTAAHVADESTALIVGTSKGPVTAWLAPPPRRATLSDVAGGQRLGFGLAEAAAHLAARLRLGAGPRLTVSAACSTGLHALIRAAMLIQSRQARRAIVVAAESSVHPLFIGSFQRLKILARPGEGCRPLDRRRSGFLISEAAAAVCLEAADLQPAGAAEKQLPARHLYLDHFALAADASHLTGADPDGKAMRYCLGRVIAAADRPVDLIHAHGTGTIVNDPLELAAIDATVLPRRSPPAAIYSHKGALGHSLGAAALVSVVLNGMAHRAGVVPPNVQTHHPLPAHAGTISREPLPGPVHRSIVTAAGFGGAIAAVSLFHR